MRKKLLYLLLLVPYFGFAQAPSTALLGTKTLYLPKQTKFTPVPGGYKAVYINFVGRHGARHLTKDIKLSYAYATVSKADSLNVLTTAGKTLKQFILNLGKEEENHVASISESGANELRGIAERMFTNQKDVFTSDEKVLVSTTKKGRTKESAEAFLAGLKTKSAPLSQNITFNYADDDHLRFYDFSKTYDEFKENGNWTIAYQKLAKAKKLNDIANRFAQKFFKPNYLAKLSQTDKINFVEDVYGFYTILNAVSAEIKAVGLSPKDLNFKTFFTPADLAALNTLGNAEDFLKKAPGLNNNGIQVRVAAPLLADFINTTDAYLKNKPVIADLRFAHAETIAPFAALMGIHGAAEATNNILTFEQVWKAENVIPFSANIQWIVYQNPTNGTHLVKFLLNEKEVAINGLSTKTFPYYNWIAVREHYLKKLKTLNLGLQDNMHEYLLKLK
ncbi:histidine-type phosphatase [Pedobacter roseus]|uniref:Multiple inositol polyphosphate phosphatase 1 n=1 Tax=Pedobacter roseus TaxID=336820 RepID=A0A7G9QMZ2_9SPHI|nr:histidine-type phosphatase [Pedobacter roseus]QNN44717.1 histidine-type phosphatase [Pedobacter roseus]